jgi:hypothetical protein
MPLYILEVQSFDVNNVVREYSGEYLKILPFE